VVDNNLAYQLINQSITCIIRLIYRQYVKKTSKALTYSISMQRFSYCEHKWTEIQPLFVAIKITLKQKIAQEAYAPLRASFSFRSAAELAKMSSNQSRFPAQRSQTFTTDRIRQTIPCVYYSAREEMHPDVTTSRSIQLVRMSFRIYNIKKTSLTVFYHCNKGAQEPKWM